MAVLSPVLGEAASLDLYYGEYDPGLQNDCQDIPIVAVSLDESIGILGNVRLCLISRSMQGLVFDRRTALDHSAIRSVIDAYTFASAKADSKGVFFVSYDLHTDSVSGASTGASIAAGMTAIFNGQKYDSRYVLTGAVDPTGKMLETGGIPIKVMALSDSGKTLVIPEGQRMQEVLERRIIDGKEMMFVRQMDLSPWAVQMEVDMVEAKDLGQMLPLIMQKI
jgi:hypothetical protein